MAQKITTENYLTINLEQLAMNSDFGKLVFTNANTKLTKVQQWFKELNDLDYTRYLLSKDQTNLIEGLRNDFIAHLNWLTEFDIGKSPNPQQEHDNFEIKVDNHFNRFFKGVVMEILPYLRQEVALQNKDERNLQVELQEVAKIKKQVEESLKQSEQERGMLQEEIKAIKESKRGVGSAHGERGAAQMALHFEKEVKHYSDGAANWLKYGGWGYVIIIGIIILLAYRYLSIDNPSWQIGLAKLVFISALWYGLSFLIKNYNVNSHLMAVNRHRAAVARTLEDFLAVNPERQTDMLKNATEAMFKNAPIGYIRKAEKDSSGSILEIINNLPGIPGSPKSDE